MDCFSGGGLALITLVLTLIIIKFLKLREENHMENNKNRTVTSNLICVSTETIWAIGTSIAANAAPPIID